MQKSIESLGKVEIRKLNTNESVLEFCIHKYKFQEGNLSLQYSLPSNVLNIILKSGATMKGAIQLFMRLLYM